MFKKQNSVWRDGFRFKKDLVPIALLVFILILGTGLRVYNLGKESYWGDEIYTILEGKQSIPQLLSSGRLDQPPAFYIPFHFWIQAFGTAEASTRSFSVLTGIGSLLLIYLIGRSLFHKNIGLISAFLLAISVFQITYSQETRFYGFFEFMVLLSYYFLIVALKSGRTLHFILYGIASIAMVYTHTYGIFVLAAQNLFFITQVKKYKGFIRAWIICQTAILISFVPYLFSLLINDSGLGGALNYQSGGTLQTPSILDPVRTIYRFVIPARGERTWNSVFISYLIAALSIVAGSSIYIARQGIRQWASNLPRLTNLQRMRNLKNELLLLFFWLLGPIALPFIISILLTPMYTDRYIIGAAPAIYLLLAWIIFSFRKIVPIVFSLGMLVILIVPGMRYYYTIDRNQQWREAAAYVQANHLQDEIIVFAGGIGTGIEQESFNWYYQGTAPNCSLGNDLTSPSAKLTALKLCTDDYKYFWIIIRNSTDFTNPIDSYKAFFADSRQVPAHLIKEQQFIDISVYLFRLSD